MARRRSALRANPRSDARESPSVRRHLENAAVGRSFSRPTSCCRGSEGRGRYYIQGHDHVRTPRRLHHLPRRLRVGRGLARLLRSPGARVPRLARRAARCHVPGGSEHLPADVGLRCRRDPSGTRRVQRRGGGLRRRAHASGFLQRAVAGCTTPLLNRRSSRSASSSRIPDRGPAGRARAGRRRCSRAGDAGDASSGRPRSWTSKRADCST